MISSVDEDVPVVIVRQLYLNFVFNTFPIAILYYDYALTFSREVEYFWSNPYRTGWVSSLFFLNRYLAIFGHIPIVIGLVPRKSCEPQHGWEAHHYKAYYGMVLQLLVAVLCAMRVYALYSKNNYILLALLALAVASMIVGFIAIATETDDILLPFCHVSLGLSNEGGQFLSIAWGGLLAFDVTVFVLTLYKAMKVGYNTLLIQALVRDGSLYFVVLFFVNLANILMLHLAPTSLKDSVTTLTNVLVFFNHCLSTTLISRLMLRLRSDRILFGHHSRGTVRTMDAYFNSSLSELGSLWFPTIMATHSPSELLEMESLPGG